MIKILENAENQMYRGGQDLAGTEDGFDVRAAGLMDGLLSGLTQKDPIANIDSGESSS